MHKRIIGALPVPFLLASPRQPAAAPAASADELVGLWKAKRWFGPEGRGVMRQAGATYTADMMGQILPVRVDNGQGRRILSRAFVARASAPFYHLRNIYYGYLWWGIDYPYKNRSVHAFFAGGAGGQAVMAIPELDLVIAIYAGNYSSGGTIHISQELIPSYALPAVREPGDDKNAPVIRRDYVSPYGPSPASGPVSRPR